MDQPDYVPLFLFPRFSGHSTIVRSFSHRLLPPCGLFVPLVLTRIIPHIIEHAVGGREEEAEGGERGSEGEKQEYRRLSLRAPLVSIRILVCGFYFKHRAHRDSRADRGDEERQKIAPASGSWLGVAYSTNHETGTLPVLSMIFGESAGSIGGIVHFSK